MRLTKLMGNHHTPPCIYCNPSIVSENKALRPAIQQYSHFLMLCLGLSLALFSTACSSLRVQPESAAAQQFSQQRAYQDAIQISGRITVHYQQNSKEQVLPGSFDWEQSAERLCITLYTPLGQTLARISQDANGAVLEQDGQAPRQAGDLDQLLNEALGWPLPVAGLRDWLQGYLPQAGGARLALAAQDQTLSTDGWQLRYASWHAAPTFPKRLDLQRYTSEAGEVSIRILIDQWKTP